MTNETNADDLKSAEEYAGVEFIGLNPHGQRMYQAKDFYDLAKRELRIPAFLAGLKAGREVKLTNEERDDLEFVRAIVCEHELTSPVAHLVQIIDRLTGLTKSHANEVGNG